MDLSISIVSYNTRGLISRCLDSIYKNTKSIKFEVIVVDNSSSDETVEFVRRNFPKVKLIANKKNNFFAFGNNQALKIAKGKFFLLMAPDAYLVDNSLKKVVDFLNNNPMVGAVDGLEIYENGNIVPTGSLFSTPLIDFYELSFIGNKFASKESIGGYRLKNKNRKKNFEIDVGCDAFLFVRTELMKKINGYDSRFKLYYTENDLCLRIKKEGYDIVHFGEAKVIHQVSASVDAIGWRKFDIYYQDLFTYYQKHGYKISGAILFGLLKIEEIILKLLKPDTIL